jgi:hypothetical protein
MRVNFKPKELTKKESSYLCVRALFRFFSPTYLLGNFGCRSQSELLFLHNESLHRFIHFNEVISVVEIFKLNEFVG